MSNREIRELIVQKLTDVIADLEANGYDISAAHAQMALDSMSNIDVGEKDNGGH